MATCSFKFRNMNVRFSANSYRIGNGLQVQMYAESEDCPGEWEPYAGLTKNLAPYDCMANFAFVDLEQPGIGREMYFWLIDNHIAIPSGRVRRITCAGGRVIEYPEFYFMPEFLNSLTGTCRPDSKEADQSAAINVNTVQTAEEKRKMSANPVAQENLKGEKLCTN